MSGLRKRSGLKENHKHVKQSPSELWNKFSHLPQVVTAQTLEQQSELVADSSTTKRSSLLMVTTQLRFTQIHVVKADVSLLPMTTQRLHAHLPPEPEIAVIYKAECGVTFQLAAPH